MIVPAKYVSVTKGFIIVTKENIVYLIPYVIFFRERIYKLLIKMLDYLKSKLHPIKHHS